MKPRHVLVLLSIAVLCMRASADDGVLEINQACAANDGCFSGDPAGFPVQITNSGSYVLTSNLDVTAATDPPNTDGIFVEVSEVTIDLNGFSIIGPVTCDGLPVSSCSQTGSGSGVSSLISQGGTADSVSVSNGTIRGLGNHAIDLQTNSRAINLVVTENGGAGLAMNSGLIEDVVASRNGDHGISTFLGVMLNNVQSRENGSDGINANSRAVIENTLSEFNANGGFDVGRGSVIRDSIARNNGVNGIFLRGGDSLVIGSTAIANGSGLGGDDGIDCDMGTSGIKGNVMAGNDGQPIRNCIQIGQNICNGSLCP